MSAFRNAEKCNQKVHRERSQPASRQHLGFLEKKKDYQKRSREHHKRQNTLKVLKKKALDRNPDEFHFNMVKSKTIDGVHKADDIVITYTDEQRKLMDTQDINYVRFKRSLEKKKIDNLKASLQLFAAPLKPQNKHIIFCESKQEAEAFNPVSHFKTHPSLASRSFNRLDLQALKDTKLPQLDDRALAEAAVEKEKKARELLRRIEREKQLKIVEEKLTLQKALLDKAVGRKKVADETKDTAAQYKFAKIRKR